MVATLFYSSAVGVYIDIDESIEHREQATNINVTEKLFTWRRI
jgi:hypothetical protein